MNFVSNYSCTAYCSELLEQMVNDLIYRNELCISYYRDFTLEEQDEYCLDRVKTLAILGENDHVASQQPSVTLKDENDNNSSNSSNRSPVEVG